MSHVAIDRDTTPENDNATPRRLHPSTATAGDVIPRVEVVAVFVRIGGVIRLAVRETWLREQLAARGAL